MEGFHRVLGGLSFLVLKYLRTTNLKCSHDEEQRLEKVILCTRNFRPDLGRLDHERIHGQLYRIPLLAPLYDERQHVSQARVQKCQSRQHMIDRVSFELAPYCLKLGLEDIP